MERNQEIKRLKKKRAWHYLAVIAILLLMLALVLTRSQKNGTEIFLGIGCGLAFAIDRNAWAITKKIRNLKSRPAKETEGEGQAETK